MSITRTLFCRNLRKCLAEWEGVSAEDIVCGNGASDVICRLVQALRPKKALLHAPAFSEYERALAGVGCGMEHYGMREENGFALDEGFLERIREGLDMVFVCNPNNPTGLLVTLN